MRFYLSGGKVTQEAPSQQKGQCQKKQALAPQSRYLTLDFFVI